ncbi:MAG TPA: PAS domain-containing protein, partial [Nitrospiraceae bacterium]|nr:PAS domain-containing protein [Nitrospiraceae bacterium]
MRESRTKENLVMRALPIVHYSAEASGEYDALWVSDNIRQVSGFSGSAFLKEPGLWVARLHPDDRERVLQEFQRIHERGMVSVEYRWQVADGTYHWLLDRAVLQPSSTGRLNEIAGFWLDITDSTERKPGPLKAEREDLERRVAERTADLSEANERLRVLSRRLMETQEMERRAIARDLHDEIGQALTAIKLNLRELREVAGDAPIEAHVTDSLEILDQV